MTTYPAAQEMLFLSQSFYGSTINATAFREAETPKGSLTLAMGKCLWFSVKIKVCQSFLSLP